MLLFPFSALSFRPSLLHLFLYPCLTLLSLEAVNLVCSYKFLSAISCLIWISSFVRQSSSHSYVYYLQPFFPFFVFFFWGGGGLAEWFIFWLHCERCNFYIFLFVEWLKYSSRCGKTSSKDFRYDTSDYFISEEQAKPCSDSFFFFFLAVLSQEKQPDTRE